MSGIVVGIDGSHNASRALEWAIGEAALRKADLTVVTVHAVPASWWTGQPELLPGDEGKLEEVRTSAEAAVKQAVTAQGDSQPTSITVTAMHGFPAKALIDASAGRDLLVVGSRGGGGFGALAMGSISSQVVHHAKCPVVVVPGNR
jgi:nucleotide-binding universal stress UspA family protein